MDITSWQYCVIVISSSLVGGTIGGLFVLWLTEPWEEFVLFVKDLFMGRW